MKSLSGLKRFPVGPYRNEVRRAVWGILALLMVCFMGMSVPMTFAAGGGDASHGQVAEDSHGGGDEHHGADDGHGTGMAATDWYRILNFAVLAAALFFIARKPLPAALNSRIAGIQEQLAGLKSKKEAAEANLVQYNEKIAALDQESEAIIQEFIRQGEEAKERIVNEAHAAAEKLKEQASKNIANEISQAKVRIKAGVVESALVKAEEMIKANITQDDQNRLVDEYLEKVVV